MLYTILVILLYKSEIKVQQAHITCFQRVNVYCLNGNFITSSDPARTTSYITLTGPRKARAIHTRDCVVGLKFRGTFFWTMKKGPKWHRGILHAVNKHEQWITMGIQMRFDQLQKTHKIKAEVTAKRFFCLLTIACNSFMRSSPVLSFSHSLTNPWINNSTKRKKFSWKTFSHEKT